MGFFKQPIIYVRLSSEQISLYCVGEEKRIEEKPLIAVKTKKSGKQIIVACGNEAETMAGAGANVQILNGFDHPRSIINNVDTASQTVRYFIRKLMNPPFWGRRPIVVLHPMEKTEGGLTGPEKRSLMEIGSISGAYATYTWVGHRLTDAELLNIPKLKEVILPRYR